jgi:exodeoxyribonuclease VII large subunit
MPDFLSEATFTVSEFLDFTNSILQPIKATIQGEITSVSHRANATYFSLNDKNEKAKLDCVIWKFRLRQLNFPLEEGQEVQIVGSPNIYKPFGKFSIVVDQVSPVGEGALKQAFEKLKKKLEQGGFFALERKRPLPKYPEKVGIITSEFGDAIKDFRTHLGGFGYRLQLCDARVEGLQAIDSIVQAIHCLNEQTDPVEVIVLTRGGGSLESLQAFNSEEVAKAIFSSRIPIISAVGHENDVTIADLVADVRASTPTDAGKILSQHWKLLDSQLSATEQLMEGVIRGVFATTRQELLTLDQSIEQGFLHELQRSRHRVSNLQILLLNAVQRFFDQVRVLAARYQMNFVVFGRGIQRLEDEVARHERGLIRDFGVQIRRHEEKIQHLAAQLRLSDPEQKLKQGYSLVHAADGTLVRRADQVQPGEKLSIRLYESAIRTQVESTE